MRCTSRIRGWKWRRKGLSLFERAFSFSVAIMPKPSSVRFLHLVAFCTLATGYSMAEKNLCGRTEAMRAETATDQLKTWNSVYRFYKRFSQCDDGSIGEGISDAVAKLLANRWETFETFAKLGSRDKGFEEFVVRHVDETIDWSHDVPKIHENARLRCPSGSSRVCKILVERTTPEGN